MEVDCKNSFTQKMDSILSMAAQGWPVLPLHYSTLTGCSCGKNDCSSVGKHPMTRSGLKDASKAKIVIANWWNHQPMANVGILTGKESGLVVLDVDPRHQGDLSLIEIQKEFGALPNTLKVLTGGDGHHYYFRYPAGTQIFGNRTNMRPGLDIRSEGGYIVAPPSIHASKKQYQWDFKTQGHTIADMPKWLEEMILNKVNPKQTIAKSSFLNDGNRNNGLCSIAGFLKSKGADNNEITSTLNAINQTLSSPLKNQEVTKISQSIARYSPPKPIIEEWAVNQNLPETIPPSDLTLQMLPACLQTWSNDISERMQVPLEFVAGPAIVMFAGMIGRKAIVAPKQKDDWYVVPNLWGCLIAPPGSLKSPAISAVFKPMNNIANRAQHKYAETKKLKAKEETIARTEIEALKDAYKIAVKRGNVERIQEVKDRLDLSLANFEENFNIREPRYITNDPTIEKLMTILEQNPQGLLLYRDELSGWLETMMHKSGREGDREFFLESWNGDNSYSMDRVSRGTISVDGVCLSVMGGLQPGKFSTYVSSVVKGGKSDDGLLQRFQLIFYPDRRKSWKKVDKNPDALALKKIEAILERLDHLPLPKKIDGHIHRAVYHYSARGQLLADVWHEKLESRLCKGEMSPLLEAHLSKFRSLMPSLALIFTLINENPDGELIHENEVQLAIEWCHYLEGQARKAYGDFIDPELAAGHRLLTKIKEGLVQDHDKCREIYRRGWKGLTTKDQLDMALNILKKYGHIKTEISVPLNGGRSENIRLHPNYLNT